MGKTLKIFDFDDTLVQSSNNVIVIHENGDETLLTSHEFASYSPVPGDEFDFSDFETYPQDAQIIENIFSDLRNSSNETDVTTIILTAREKATPVVTFLSDNGIPSSVRVIAVGSADPRDKAHVVDAYLKSGVYTDVFVYEDNIRNIKEISKTSKRHGVNFDYVHVKTPGRKLVEEYVKEIIHEIQDMSYNKKVPSAGTILLKDHGGALKILGLRLYNRYDFPKGKIESGETPFQAAMRETSEEASITQIEFPWGLEPVIVEHVTLFIGLTHEDPEIKKNPETQIYEHHGAKWLDWDEALRGFTSYLKPALVETMEIIKKK